jgi:transcriptional regulator with GAF, ATPase, and Fis domain
MSDNHWLLEKEAAENRLDFPPAEGYGEDTCEAGNAQNSIFRSLRKVINSSYTRFELFLKLCAKLDKFFVINRASLALYDDQNNHMSITHIQVGKDLKNGVQINIMAEKTIMKRVLDDDHIFVLDFAEDLETLEIEKKILLDRESHSLAIIPLSFAGKKIGTLNVTSGSYYAFSILESHLFDYLFQKTAEKLAELPQ